MVTKSRQETLPDSGLSRQLGPELDKPPHITRGTMNKADYLAKNQESHMIPYKPAEEEPLKKRKGESVEVIGIDAKKENPELAQASGQRWRRLWEGSHAGEGRCAGTRDRSD